MRGSAMALFLSDCGSHDVLLRRVRDVRDLARDPALVHDENAIAHAHHLGQLRADHQNGFALGGQFIDQQINFIFGADVNAARRFIENDDFTVAL